MPKLITEQNKKKLHEFIQLNPFDAVIFLKCDTSYTVELTNTNAITLFATQHIPYMEPATFFGEACWQQLHPLLQRNGETVRLAWQGSKQYNVHIQHHALVEGDFVCIVMRQAVQASFVEEMEIAKHVYFVEQYVDPVISLNLNGCIIYENSAAVNKLEQMQERLIGKTIFDVIDIKHVQQYELLFRKTLNGQPMGMLQCLLKTNVFSEGHVYLKTLPTYWDGQIIGAHVVIKNVGDLLNERTNYQFTAYQDELTSLLNRRALYEQWALYMDEVELKTALILVNLDRFKKFNESLGKQKADGMLLEVSGRFKRLRNENCEVFRYNGDEFVFLVRFNNKDEVEAIANHILDELQVPVVVDQQEYYITASIGIATNHVDQLIDLDTLLHRADQALFYVKNHGRGHYRFYRKEMSLAFPNEALMEAHLHRAIEFGELQVHFQPQIELETNRIDSFEALVRWENKKFGAVPPSQFIPLAESSGLILTIGDWILERVFQYQKEWRELGYRPVRVAINISPKQFKQERFAAKIEDLLVKYGVEAEYIELEITEGSMMNVKETSSILNHLKQIGVYVSLDDFGTGYSSLSYLKTYPIDIIKIDQSFIADIEKDEKNEAIIKAIILLSHNLGLEVVAEGVEEKNQERFLKTFKCQKVQGYLYNKPLPVEDVIEQYFMN